MKKKITCIAYIICMILLNCHIAHAENWKWFINGVDSYWYINTDNVRYGKDTQGVYMDVCCKAVYNDYGRQRLANNNNDDRYLQMSYVLFSYRYRIFEDMIVFACLKSIYYDFSNQIWKSNYTRDDFPTAYLFMPDGSISIAAYNIALEFARW